MRKRKKNLSAGTTLVALHVLVGQAAILLSGCATPPKSIEIKGDAEQVLTRDAGGNSLSVAVRLYQLKGSEEFSKLTFDIAANGRPDAELIGADLLEKSEAILVPGGSFSNSVTIREDAKYVGLVAFFRQPDPHYWRFLVDADKVRREGLSFKAKDCYLILKNPKPTPIPGQPIDAPPQCDQGRNVIAGSTAAPKRQPPSAKPASATASKH